MSTIGRESALVFQLMTASCGIDPPSDASDPRMPDLRYQCFLDLHAGDQNRPR